MFIFIEMILYGLILITGNDLLKYLGIFICFLYGLYTHKRVTWVLVLVLIADYCLLLNDYYMLGLFIFIVIQCCYHMILKGSLWFYIWFIFLVGGCLEAFALCYMMMSIQNIITAYRKQHWLFLTCVLLGMCDIGVMLQFVLKVNIPWIWWFYLPSQILFIKKAPSNEDGTIVKED